MLTPGDLLAGEVLAVELLERKPECVLRRTLAAVGAALVSFLALLLLTGWAVRSLTPLSRATGSRGTPDNSWLVGGGQYHPASQYWPLQLTYAAILLVLAAALLAAGWRATRPRHVV